MKKFIKEIIISIILSLILILLLAILISLTTLSEKFITPAVIGITFVSLLIGAFRISKNKKEKGILNGSILGGTYMIILYLISGFMSLDFSLSINSIIMIFLGILGGIIGGIIGVNF